MSTVQTFRYPAMIEPGEEAGFVVSFPDVPEAITAGDTRQDAVEMATDALGLALLVYVREGRPLPQPRPNDHGLTPVSIKPEVAAKLALLEAFASSGLTKAELGRRLRKDEKEIRRILDPMHPTKLAAMTQALAALGRRLVIGVEDVAA